MQIDTPNLDAAKLLVDVIELDVADHDPVDIVYALATLFGRIVARNYSHNPRKAQTALDVFIELAGVGAADEFKRQNAAGHPCCR